MRAQDLVFALNVITRGYPHAEVVPQETDPRQEGHFIVIQTPDLGPMRLHPHLEDILKGLGFGYSESHGACWYVRL